MTENVKIRVSRVQGEMIDIECRPEDVARVVADLREMTPAVAQIQSTEVVVVSEQSEPTVRPRETPRLDPNLVRLGISVAAAAFGLPFV
jgi:hypothetical protein